jgi:hypothetical protein
MGTPYMLTAIVAGVVYVAFVLLVAQVIGVVSR